VTWSGMLLLDLLRNNIMNLWFWKKKKPSSQAVRHELRHRFTLPKAPDLVVPKFAGYIFDQRISCSKCAFCYTIENLPVGGSMQYGKFILEWIEAKNCPECNGVPGLIYPELTYADN
jgi:hypothetical protein